jgi:hypothetical protein
VSQNNTSNASVRPSAQNAASDCPSLLPSHGDAQGRTTGDDSVLTELGRRFEEITALVQTLYDPAEPDSHLEEIEAALARLEPVEYAIMTLPACTPAGLGVKARHAAHVMSEYWNGSIDQIDWDARAVRLLIEAVCKAANVPLPLPSVGATAPRGEPCGLRSERSMDIGQMRTRHLLCAGTQDQNLRNRLFYARRAHWSPADNSRLALPAGPSTPLREMKFGLLAA